MEESKNKIRHAVNQIYQEKEKEIIIGLTGRTGSGCSKVAEILCKNGIDKLDLRDIKEYDYDNVNEISLIKLLKMIASWKKKMYNLNE